jgi:hypothetical protein
MTKIYDKNGNREVSKLLTVGVLCVPQIFSWLTLRKGYTSRVRLISLGWAALASVLMLMGEPPVTAKQEAVIGVNIKKLLSDYGGNEVSADNKYKGKLLQFSGMVLEVKKKFFKRRVCVLRHWCKV